MPKNLLPLLQLFVNMEMEEQQVQRTVAEARANCALSKSLTILFLKVMLPVGHLFPAEVAQAERVGLQEVEMMAW